MLHRLTCSGFLIRMETGWISIVLCSITCRRNDACGTIIAYVLRVHVVGNRLDKGIINRLSRRENYRLTVLPAGGMLDTFDRIASRELNTTPTDYPRLDNNRRSFASRVNRDVSYLGGHSVLDYVLLPAGKTSGGRCTVWQPNTTVTNPTCLTRWYADHQRIIRHVMCNCCSSPDKAIAAQGDAAHNRRIRSDRSAFFYNSFPIFVAPNDVAAGIDYIGEYHRRTTKDVVFEFYASIDRNIILDLDVIADLAFRAYHHILAEVTTCSDLRAAHDVREMPNLGA